MRDDLTGFLRHLGGFRSPNTTKTYEATLVAFFRFLATRGVEGVPARADVEAFLGRPREDGGRRAATSWNRALAALRAFVKFARRDLGWTADPTEGISFLREPERDPVFLTAFELRRLFQVVAASDNGFARARDTAIVALLAHAGLRVHELVALDVEQIDIATATLVGVRGKGGTLHALPLNGPTLALLGNWLAVRNDAAPNAEHALFVTPRGKRLSIRSVQRLLVRLRKAIGTAKKLTPHALRHTAGTLLLTLGTDLGTVAEMLRHSDLNTTRRYTHLIDERRRDAVRRLEVTIPKEILPVPSSTTQSPLLQNKVVALNSEVAPDISSPPALPVAPDSLDVENDFRDAA